jgi:hypothetical protein
VTLLSLLSGSVDVLSSKILIPTFDSDSSASTGTQTIEYTNETTLQIPYKNGTATIDIEEYKRCVADSNQRLINSVDSTGSKDFDYLQSLSMEGCIIFNASNRD